MDLEKFFARLPKQEGSPPTCHQGAGKIGALPLDDRGGSKASDTAEIYYAYIE